VKSLNEDIKNNDFKPIYLLYGEEAFLKRQYKEKFKKAISPEKDDMNYAYFEGKGAQEKEIISLADTMPFFADKRLVVVENSGFFKGKREELATYMSTIPDTVCLLFVEQEVDKRGRLYKEVTKVGRTVEMKTQDERTLLLWVASLVKKEGKHIREGTIRYLIERAGASMEALSQELQKLFSYAVEKEEITREDIDAIVTVQISNHIFDMVEAVATKQQKKALDLYYELLALKEPPMRTLYMLGRQFRLLYEVKQLKKRGYDKAQIAKKSGLHPFVAGKYMNQCTRFSTSQLKGIMEESLNLEKAVKTGDLKDTISVELFIVKHSI